MGLFYKYSLYYNEQYTQQVFVNPHLVLVNIKEFSLDTLESKSHFLFCFVLIGAMPIDKPSGVLWDVRD